MKSFIVICLGRFGGNLAKRLAQLGCEVLAVDSDAERVQNIADYVTHAVTADTDNEEVLQSLGVRNFDCAIVSLSTQAQSCTLITMMLKEMGVKFVVAKASSDVHARVLAKVGADRVVFPEKDMSLKLAQRLVSNNVLDFIELSPHFTIIETLVPTVWIGKTLRNLNLRETYKVNLVALKRGNRIDTVFSPDQPFEKEDLVVIAGKNADMDHLLK